MYEEDDFVRIEIASALERRITVIPVLVEGAEMPSKEKLPSTLQKLARRQAAQVRPGSDFRSDFDRLKKALWYGVIKAIRVPPDDLGHTSTVRALYPPQKDTQARV